MQDKPKKTHVYIPQLPLSKEKPLSLPEDNFGNSSSDAAEEESDEFIPDREESDACVWSPGSETGMQGSDLMSAKRTKQASPLRSRLGATDEDSVLSPQPTDAVTNNNSWFRHSPKEVTSEAVDEGSILSPQPTDTVNNNSWFRHRPKEVNSEAAEEESDEFIPDREESDACVWSPGSETGMQGSDLMSAKRTKQVSPLRSRLGNSLTEGKKTDVNDAPEVPPASSAGWFRSPSKLNPPESSQPEECTPNSASLPPSKRWFNKAPRLSAAIGTTDAVTNDDDVQTPNKPKRSAAQVKEDMRAQVKERIRRKSIDKEAAAKKEASDDTALSGDGQPAAGEQDPTELVYREWINRALTDSGFEALSADTVLEQAFHNGEKLRELLQSLTGISVRINTRMDNVTIR